jgi:hypothetical protein
MRHGGSGFAGWGGGARALAPEIFQPRDREVERQLGFLLRCLTPRTVFMDLGSPDGELALRAAGYVERAWCVDAAARPARAPCNLRCAPMGGVPLASIDVAFSTQYMHSKDVRELLAPGGVWFIHGAFVPAAALRNSGFPRVQYCAGGLVLPAPLARVARRIVTAAYRAR